MKIYPIESIKLKPSKFAAKFHFERNLIFYLTQLISCKLSKKKYLNLNEKLKNIY